MKTAASAAEVNALFLRWLARNARNRFLAVLHYMEPHAPYAPPPHLRPPAPAGVRRTVAAGAIDRWQHAIHSPAGLAVRPHELQHLRRLYDAEVRGWDEELARLLAALAERGLLDTTIVVVTADHGEAFQEHGRLTHGYHLYDELLHVPFVVVGPGIAARRVGWQTMGVDVLPTVAALLGLDAPAGLPGTNALALAADRPAFAMTLGGRLADLTGGELVALRTPAAKLLWLPALGRYELYDLAADPTEQHDLWGTSADGAPLAAQLATWRATTPIAGAAVADPAFRERLRALGYAD
jgi:arylsulfatase A-like enzyme